MSKDEQEAQKDRILEKVLTMFEKAIDVNTALLTTNGGTLPESTRISLGYALSLAETTIKADL